MGNGAKEIVWPSSEGFFSGDEKRGFMKRVKEQRKKERIEAAIKGNPVDRIPLVFWQSHSSSDDAQASWEDIYHFYQETDTDMLVLPLVSLYDVKQTESGHISLSIQSDRWKKEELYLNELIEKVQGEAPVVWTMESPFSFLLSLEPKACEKYTSMQLKEMLGQLTDLACFLVRHVIELGADGIRLRTRVMDYDVMDEDFYREYGKPYDVAVLSASSGWCDIFSLSGQSLMMDVLKNYPVDILHRDSHGTLPTVEEMHVLSQKCIMGGFLASSVMNGNKAELTHDLYEMIKVTGGKRVILSPDRSLKENQSGMLSFIRSQKEDIEKKIIS